MSDLPSSKVRLLSDEDIYDVYGCQFLLRRNLSTQHKAKVENRIQIIQQMYVNSAKSRIRSEARYCGLGVGENDSLNMMLRKVRDLIEQDVTKQMMSGAPVNLMSSILKAHRASGGDLKGINLKHFGIQEEPPEKPKPKLPGVDPEWFTRGYKQGERLFDNPKWHVIAEAFLAIEEATDPMDILVKIDILNSLQHNSFHILIDLQTGRMLEGKSDGEKYGKHEEARKTLQVVLDIAKGKEDVTEYSDKMSKDVKELIDIYKKVPDKDTVIPVPDMLEAWKRHGND